MTSGEWLSAILAFFAAALAAANVLPLRAISDIKYILFFALVRVIRHGEKPEGGFGQLNCQGLNRALALALFMHPMPSRFRSDRLPGDSPGSLWSRRRQRSDRG
jgi:hypothetical protein